MHDDTDSEHDLTVLIRKSMEGDAAATDQLFVLAYDELRKIAKRAPRVGAHGETLQPTAITNELWIVFRERFPDLHEPIQRGTFFYIAGLAMRTLLRDYERAKKTKKRGGEFTHTTLGDHDPVDHRERDLFDLADGISLSDALDKLEVIDKELFDVVILRYYGGRSIDETAEFLHVGKTTVKKATQAAMAWLRQELGDPK